MTIRLEQAGSRESPYERPNQPWICGRAAEGNPCHVGPEERGRCTAAQQLHCQPRKISDRWHCARPAPFGGPCDPGPQPDGSCGRPAPAQQVCQPRRSWRARRGRLCAALCVVTVGMLAFTLGGPWRWRVLSPGELTAAHAAIVIEGQADNCAACHAAADTGGDSALGWIGFAAPGGAAGADDDSHRCLNCHFRDANASGGQATLAHSVPGERLDGSHKNTSFTAGGSALLAIASLSSGPDHHGGLACASCHVEHRSADFDLTSMSDTKCQACHQVKFASFSGGHPPFIGASLGTSAINFDHISHSQTHFGQTPFDCSRCHVADESDRTMLLRPFENSCAGCHAQSRTDHHGEQIRSVQLRALQLPEMELDEDVAWPIDTAVGETIPPIMWLLLIGDDSPEAQAAMQSLLDDDEARMVPYDWIPDDEGLTTHLAAAILRLARELAAGDADAIRSRLSRALGLAPDDPAIENLSRQLSAAQFAMSAFAARWLAASEADSATGPDWLSSDESSGWMVDEDEFAVSYRPIAHEDALARALLDALAARSNRTDAASGADDGAAGLRSRIISHLSEELTSQATGGPLYAACLRCHTLTSDGVGRSINWRGRGRAASPVGFGKFNHGTHIAILEGRNGCLRCHQLATTDFSSAASPQQSTSCGFLPHQRDGCATCHTSGRASEGCLTCHDYHFVRP